MPVYMVAVVKKKDKQKYNEYIAALTELIESFGGRYLVRGGRVTPLFKGTELERRRVDKVVIIEFPTAAHHGAVLHLAGVFGPRPPQGSRC